MGLTKKRSSEPKTPARSQRGEVTEMSALYKEHKNKNKGFTLAELLIVVAIIGVLVAVSIPIFTSQLAKAREATCKANRRSLLAVVRTTAMTEEKSEKEVFSSLYPGTGDAGKKEYPCPSGGAFSYNETTGQIKCSVHDESSSGESGTTISIGGEKAMVHGLTSARYKTKHNYH